MGDCMSIGLSVARAPSAEANEESDAKSFVPLASTPPAYKPNTTIERALKSFRTIFGKIMFALDESGRRQGDWMIRCYRHFDLRSDRL